MISIVRPLLTGRDRDDQGTAPIILLFFGRSPGDSGPSFAFAAAFGRMLPPKLLSIEDLEISRMRPVGKIKVYLAVWWVAFLLCLPVWAEQPTEQPSAPQTQADGDNQPSNADPETMLPHFHDTRFWLSGQANFIFQTHPDFHAPYSGKNSLSRVTRRPHHG